MKNKLLKYYFFLLFSFTIFQASITVWYNFPITPLKEQYSGFISSYMDPLFTQTWTLFAPTPVNTNIVFEIKLTHENNEETAWINFSDLIHDKSQSNFFSHYQFYASALTQMQNRSVKASESISNFWDDKEEEMMKKKAALILDERQEGYLEELIDSKDIEKFIEENDTVNSLYGLVYTYLIKTSFNEITDLQIRISSEYFPAYGKKEENVDNGFLMYYLPKISTKHIKN